FPANHFPRPVVVRARGERFAVAGEGARPAAAERPPADVREPRPIDRRTLPPCPSYPGKAPRGGRGQRIPVRGQFGVAAIVTESPISRDGTRRGPAGPSGGVTDPAPASRK